MQESDMRIGLASAVLAAGLAWTCGVKAQEVPPPAQKASISIAQVCDIARMCFERARKLGFPAAGQTSPYILKAEFTTRSSSGVVETGTYSDIWLSDTKWRREAVLGKSRFIRSRDGKKFYRIDEGPDEALLQFVLTAMEPLPTIGSAADSDWRIRADAIGGEPTTRVARGLENADGSPDKQEFEGYWFDGTGQLVQSYLNQLHTQRSNFEDFNGVHVARKIEVLLGDKVGMKINVTLLGPAGSVDKSMFTMKGHGWARQSTSEVR
jgi:hypothetical protein